MLRALIRLLTGYERDPELVRWQEELRAQMRADWEAEAAATAHYPPIPQWGRDFPVSGKPYEGHPVPEGVSLEPDAEFLDEVNEAWTVAPASGGGEDVVVFHCDYRATTCRGEILYEDNFRRDEEGREPGAWLADIIAIHQRLGNGGEADATQLCKRIVRFRGSTPASYRLENPMSGILQFVPPRERHDSVLALHQRWALQYLAACRHVHSKGIVLHAPNVEESIWLRTDFSLVVAMAFVTASCSELGVQARHWVTGGSLESPFEPEVDYVTSELDEVEVRVHEQPKTDLYNWACWVHKLMTDCESLGEESDDEEDGDELIDEDWPVLRDEQLGPCLVKAWKGEYESAEDALQEVSAVLAGCGRVLVDGEEDEIAGFDWEGEFKYDPSSKQISRSLVEKAIPS